MEIGSLERCHAPSGGNICRCLVPSPCQISAGLVAPPPPSTDETFISESSVGRSPSINHRYGNAMLTVSGIILTGGGGGVQIKPSTGSGIEPVT